MAEVFLDSNILVYAVDSSDPKKQSVARQIISETRFAVSSQVLSEFFWIVTRKLAEPLTVTAAQQGIDNICIAMADPVVEIDEQIVRNAIKLSSRYQLPYWDGMILATAKRSGAKRLITEDLNDGALYDGILIDNPFDY
jgi:predicted nucleic acid-binding protein